MTTKCLPDGSFSLDKAPNCTSEYSAFDVGHTYSLICLHKSSIYENFGLSTIILKIAYELQKKNLWFVKLITGGPMKS